MCFLFFYEISAFYQKILFYDGKNMRNAFGVYQIHSWWFSAGNLRFDTQNRVFSLFFEVWGGN